jgi:tRNA A-37 threonylcarbamoyl transferase component Bud32
VATYLTTHYWPHAQPPVSWEIARLSRAVYLYRETSTNWAAVAKFYTLKVGDEATHWARHEFDCIQRVRTVGLAEGNGRVVRALAVIDGILLLEYINGLTLEDGIAIRSSQPGTLTTKLKLTVNFLAKLHSLPIPHGEEPDFRKTIVFAHQVLQELADKGILNNESVISNGIRRLIDHWAAKPVMQAFTPVLTHGDVTPSNFIFPLDGGLVAVDWEFLYVQDPAIDLGYLMAEMIHNLKQYGGQVAEAAPFIQHLVNNYYQSLPSRQDITSLLERACFYQALTMLRIARNDSLSALDRMSLVVQAMTLFSADPAEIVV